MQHHYRTLFEQMPAAIAVFDTDGVVVEVNQACCQLMGATAQEIVGSDLRTHLSPELLDVLHRALAGETVTYEGEHHFAQFSGQFWLQSRWAPLVDERGQVDGGMVGDLKVTCAPATPDVAVNSQSIEAGLEATSINGYLGSSFDNSCVTQQMQYWRLQEGQWFWGLTDSGSQFGHATTSGYVTTGGGWGAQWAYSGTNDYSNIHSWKVVP